MRHFVRPCAQKTADSRCLHCKGWLERWDTILFHAFTALYYVFTFLRLLLSFFFLLVETLLRYQYLKGRQTRS